MRLVMQELLEPFRTIPNTFHDDEVNHEPPIIECLSNAIFCTLDETNYAPLVYKFDICSCDPTLSPLSLQGSCNPTSNDRRLE
jgi:hypothetical protein